MSYRFDREEIDFSKVMGDLSSRWPTTLVAMITLLVAVGFYTSVYTVQPEERAVVKRFGAVVKTSAPGLHFKLPFGIDTIQRVATERVLKEEFGFRTVATGHPSRYSTSRYEEESLMLSGD